MHRAYGVVLSAAALTLVLLPGSLEAQAPPDDRGSSQPAPVPPLPPGPAAPVPAPPATKEEEVERQPSPEPETAAEPQRVPEQLLESRAPTFVGPDLFNPPAHQGWLTVTPSLTLSAEYYDNLFFSERNRQSDVIFGLTPGVTMSIRRPEYRLAVGYLTSAQLFLDETDLNNFGKQQQFFADGFYQVSPRVSVSVTDRFVFGRDSSALTSSGASVGLQESWRNTFIPRLRWQATPTTDVGVFVSHTIVRFDETAGENSDTYRAGIGANRRITQRLTGSLGASVAFLDFQGNPDAWTYTPRLGATYAVTPTLQATVSGGPSILDREGETTITPAVAAGLTQTFKFGTVGVGYDRAVTAETVGLSDRQSFFASIAVPTLVRGLQFGFTPYYSIVDQDITNNNTTIKVLTLNLRATYQIARNISLIGSYTYFHQINDTGRSSEEIDQNRVFLGVQYAFPINLY
jgi:hypothetical protein